MVGLRACSWDLGIAGSTDVIVIGSEGDARGFARTLRSAMEQDVHERTLRRVAMKRPDGNAELKEIL